MTVRVIEYPVPIPTDRLCGLIDCADSAMAKLVIALVAIHSLGKTETSRLLLVDDLDLQVGTLIIQWDLARHTVYFDEVTHSVAIACLRDRCRWPRTANPHLLVSGQTAGMDTRPPISSMVMNDIFKPHGLSASKLRQDRILDEAKHTLDPVSPHARGRHLRQDRHEVRLRRPPRTALHSAPVTCSDH